MDEERAAVVAWLSEQAQAWDRYADKMANTAKSGTDLLLRTQHPKQMALFYRTLAGQISEGDHLKDKDQ